MSSAEDEQFRRAIQEYRANCLCCCSECCTCERPVHNSSVSKELREDPRFTQEVFSQCMARMRIPGTTGRILTHSEKDFT